MRHGVRVAIASRLPASVVDAFGDCLFRSAPEASRHQRRHERNARHNDPIRNGRDSDRDRHNAHSNHPSNEKQGLGIFGEHETSVATGNMARCSELHGVRPALDQSRRWRQVSRGRLTRDNGVTCGDRSIVKDDTQERAVHLEPAVVFDQPELAELVHEEVHPGARRADHFRERLL